MTIEQLSTELCERVLLDTHTWDGKFESDLLKSALYHLNIMTGGAFYKSVEKLPDDYQFPTEVNNG